MLSSDVLSQLHPLIGLQFTAAGRAADLEWFSFGEDRTVLIDDESTKIVSDYALHVQCAWRICDSSRIIVASRDRYYPPDPTTEVEGDFDWDVSGGNLCDIRIRELMDSFNGQFPRVERITADNVGSLTVFLSSSIVIEVFPDNSYLDEDSEHWRFFRPYIKQPHFVV